LRTFAWLLVALGLFLMLVAPVVGFGVFALGLVVLAVRRPDPEGRPCPFCAEPVQRAATLCPHCRSQIPAEDSGAAWREFKQRWWENTRRRPGK
jgi:hypothetical protein